MLLARKSARHGTAASHISSNQAVQEVPQTRNLFIRFSILMSGSIVQELGNSIYWKNVSGFLA